jgi:hypothetical protein
VAKEVFSDYMTLEHCSKKSDGAVYAYAHIWEKSIQAIGTTAKP